MMEGLPQRQVKMAKRSVLGFDSVNFLTAAMQTAFGAYVTKYLVKNRWPPQDLAWHRPIRDFVQPGHPDFGWRLHHIVRDKRYPVLGGIVGVGLAASWRDPYAFVPCYLLNAASGAAFGVVMTVVAADLTQRTGWFNLALCMLGFAISVVHRRAPSLGARNGGFWRDRGGDRIGLVGLCGLLLMWLARP